MDVQLDISEMVRLADRQQELSRSGCKYAARDSLNDLAFQFRKDWAGQMREEFVIRNRWTLGSIRVEKARAGAVATMSSAVGSGLDYLAFQERGGTHTGGKEGAMVPTSYASGQFGANPRTKVVRSTNRVKRLTLAATKRARRAKRGPVRLAAVARAAREQNLKTIFWENTGGGGPKQGIYRIGKRRGIKLIWAMDQGSIRVRPTPTMDMARVATMAKAQPIVLARLRQQIALRLLHLRGR